MLMPMLAAARGIERRRFAGGAWMSDAGGAPMMSSVPAPIAVIVEAVDASWQTGVLNDLSACRGVSMINVGRTAYQRRDDRRIDRRGDIGIIFRVIGAVTGVRRFNGAFAPPIRRPQHKPEGEAAAATPQLMIWFGDAMQRSQPWKPEDQSIASGALRRCEVPPSFCNCFAMPRPPACWWRRSPGLDWDDHRRIGASGHCAADSGCRDDRSGDFIKDALIWGNRCFWRSMG